MRGRGPGYRGAILVPNGRRIEATRCHATGGSGSGAVPAGNARRQSGYGVEKTWHGWQLILILVGLPGVLVSVLMIYTMPDPARRTISNQVGGPGYGSGPFARVHCVIHGVSNYKQTGLLQAHAAYSLLQSPPKKAGWAPAKGSLRAPCHRRIRRRTGRR